MAVSNGNDNNVGDDRNLDDDDDDNDNNNSNEGSESFRCESFIIIN